MPREVIRVAAVIDTAILSGPGRQLAALAARARTADVEFLVVTFRREGRPRSLFVSHLERLGVPVVVLPESGPRDFALVGRLGRALVEWGNGPDIVQTHGYRPTALAYALRRAGAAWPWIGFYHGATAEDLKVRVYHWLDRRMLTTADRVVVMSEVQRAKFARMGDKVRVLYNAVLPQAPDEPEHVIAARTALGRVNSPHPVVGVVGRLSPEKGVDVFLHALALLNARGFPFTAVIVGEGPERTRLERLRDVLKIRPHLHFLGNLHSVGPVYERIDLLVIPSHSEGLPNVLLESLQADVPVVGTRVGAIPEVLGTSPAGIVVPPHSASALADAIESGLALKRDPASARARRQLAERFSLARRIEDHRRLYGELLGEQVWEPVKRPVPVTPFA